MRINGFSKIKQIQFTNKKGKAYRLWCVVDTFKDTFQIIPHGEKSYWEYKLSAPTPQGR